MMMMNVSVFSTHQYDKLHLERAKQSTNTDIEFVYHEKSLSSTTVSLAKGSNAVCIFVNDIADAEILKELHQYGVRAIFLRCAGYNNVDLEIAAQLDYFVATVPSYSPESVAEYAVALLQTLNRKTAIAHHRVRVGNFALDGLCGITLHGKTVGIMGTGRIGICFARIMHGFGCKLLAYDPYPNQEFSQYGTFVNLETLLQQSHVISLHCPLMPSTKYIINQDSLAKMQAGTMLINVSRGGLLDSKAVIESLKKHHLGGLALDVYEKESAVFYADHSTDIIEDDTLMRLMTFPNVLISGHQAFFTEEALNEISMVTIENINCFIEGKECKNNLIKGDRKIQQVTKPIRT